MTAMATRQMKKQIAELGVPEVPEFLDQIVASGGHLWACRMSADMMHLDEADLYERRRGHHQRRRLHREDRRRPTAVHLTTTGTAMTVNGRDGHPKALTVAHQGGDRFRIRVRGHEIDVDQPVGDGGEDTAPTPTELFVAGLASCVAFYARRYLARHGLPADGLEVTAEYETWQPARARRRGPDRGDASSRAAAAAAGRAARRRLALHRPQHTDHSSGRRHPARRRGVGTPPRGCHPADVGARQADRWRRSRTSANTCSGDRVASTVTTYSLRRNRSSTGSVFVVVVAQPHGQRLRGVVLAGHEGAAADVARVRGLGRWRDQVVVQAAPRAQPPGEDPRRTSSSGRSRWITPSMS